MSADVGNVNSEGVQHDAAMEIDDEHPLTQPIPVAQNILLEGFPHLGKEALGAMQKYEVKGISQLASYEKTIDGHLDTIDELLNLNSQLAKHKDGQEISQEIKEIFGSLKEKAIDFGDINKLSKEKKNELKSILNSHIDQNRTKIQTLYTRIQVTTQNMSSVNETMKRTLLDINRLIERILSNTAKG